MPTIKREVDMTAHEFITYGIQNNIKNIILEAKNEKCKERAIIHFNENAMPIVSRDVNIHHVFEVEVEEPITEDMKLHTVERFISRYENKYRYATHDNKSIKDILNNRLTHVETTHIYAEIDNDLVLIWRDGKLVE
ncbi:hypothetical protein LCFBJUUZ_CDS0077 [Staphylococcus phage PG-2021_76]